jgi:2-polyprenyl-6-methoxyphenol hydroxylase-like FAD-dependent oxidoreductase
LEQFKTEKLLTRRLKQAGVEVERGIELVSFQESVDHVSLALRRTDGSEMTAETAYLLGADGSHSTVRTGLGLRLEGETLDAIWLTADVKIRWDHDPSEMVAYLTEEGIAFIAAMNDDRWRVIVNVPGITREQADKVTVEEIQTLFPNVLESPFRSMTPSGSAPSALIREWFRQ